MQLKGKEADVHGIEVYKNDVFVSTGVTSDTFTLGANIEQNSKPTVEVNEQETEDYSINYKDNKLTVNGLDDTIENIINIDYVGWSHPMEDEACSNIDGDGKEYQIDSTSKRILDIFSPLTVKIDGNAQIRSSYEIDPFEGIVKFKESKTGNVTIDGSYVKIIELGRLFNWELNMTAERVDGTTFREEFQREVPIMPAFDGSIEGYHIDPYYAEHILNDGKAFIAQFWLDYDRYYIGWINIELSITSDKADLIKENISFTGYRHLERKFDA
ncbi:MAG: hypothetical protein ACOCQD_03115 [archaeon]